jgi:hypothetical protein
LNDYCNFFRRINIIGPENKGKKWGYEEGSYCGETVRLLERAQNIRERVGAKSLATLDPSS